MLRRSGCLAALRPKSHACTHFQQARYASFNSAIQKGLRETRYHDPTDRPSRNRPLRDRPSRYSARGSEPSQDPSDGPPQTRSFRDRRSRDSSREHGETSRGRFGRERRTDNLEGGSRHVRDRDSYPRPEYNQSRKRRDLERQSHKVLRDLKASLYEERMRGVFRDPRRSHGGQSRWDATPNERRPYGDGFSTDELKVPWKPSQEEQLAPKKRDEDRQSRALLRKTYLVPPRKIPYTTAYSEFIYGTSAVKAALQCGRRKFHVLYIYVGEEEAEGIGSNKSSADREANIASIRKLGLAMGANVKNVVGTWLDAMDAMSGGRPHNGFVLECSPLPKLPVESYGRVAHSATHFDVDVCPQSAEEAAVNGTDGHIPRRTFEEDYSSKSPRVRHPYPFTLLIEGVRDTGNMGAIIRSAYYFGADAVAISTLNTNPISAVTIKASAGAAENIPIFTVRDPVMLIRKSQANGWRFFAAEAPDSIEAAESNNFVGRRSQNQGPKQPTKPVLNLADLRTQLNESPCVLMLGSEDKGLRGSLRSTADAYVGIPGAFTGRQNEDSAGVDSLNVSVASALLLEAFLGGQEQVQAAAPSGGPERQAEARPLKGHDDTSTKVF